jgi:dTDP-4-amino-4,6-dideoxygalactose transaminase
VRGVIPFLDLKAQYNSIKDELDQAVLKVLASTQYILGDEVAAFEKEFAAFCNVKHAIAVNTGTSALHLGMLAAGIGPGDEVITVPFTFVASVSAILYAGATPVFVDIDPVTFTMDPAKVEAAITPKTKAILPVHLYGQMAEMDPIMAIAKRHKLGSIGLSSAFSFYPGKNLGAAGEGGAVVTNDDEQAKTMRMLRDWGQEQRYHHVLKGFNFRMDGIQGAILRVKLKHLEDWTERRRDHGHHYSELLKGSKTVRPPVELADRRHVYHVYAVRTGDREALQNRLKAEGIATGLHYPIPVHLQKAHLDLGYAVGDFPESEKASKEVLSLPIYPEMTSTQVEEVVSAVEEGAYVA